MYSANRLRQEIVGKGRRPAWVADQLGLHRTTIYRFMDGSRSISADMAEKLAEVLEIPVEALMEEQVAA